MWPEAMRFLTNAPPTARVFIVLVFAVFLPFVNPSLHVDSYGVYPVEAGDTSMVFYANVSHPGDPGEEDIIGRLEMEKCCMKLSNGTDCETMKLIGGLGLVFHPKRNITLQAYFVNFDLLDREGNCCLRLMTKPVKSSKDDDNSPWEKGEEFNVTFDTVLPEPNLLNKLWIAVGGSMEGLKICNSDNDNSLHDCANQDCHLRFGGKRSFYDPETDSCQATQACEGGKDSMLSSATGACRTTHSIKNIGLTFSAEMRSTDSSASSGKSQNNSKRHVIPLDEDEDDVVPVWKPSGLTCIHGKLVTGSNGLPNCTCYGGWRSESVEEQEGSADNSTFSVTHRSPVYKMCSVPPSFYEREEIGRLLIVFYVVALMIVLGIIVACISRRNGVRSGKSYSEIMDASSEEEIEKEEDPNAVLTEIANRREPHKTSSVKVNYKNDKAPPPSGSSAPAQENAQTSTAPSAQNVFPGPSDPGFPADVGASMSTAMTPSDQSTLAILVDSEEKLHFSKSSENFLTPKGSHNPDKVFDVQELARRTPSMDEMLDLSSKEKIRAHIPMNPLPLNNNNNILADYAIVEIHNPFRRPSTPLTSSSETMVTLKKKEEWAQYFKAVSEEELRNVKVFKYSDYEEVDEENNNLETGGASKVQSLPEMHSSARILAEPPKAMVQKSIEKMTPEEFQNRQIAYRILSSLSIPREEQLPPTTQSYFRPSASSIWSNVASENAEAVDPEEASSSRSSSYGDVRQRNIYGDLGSDGDSDGALETLAESTGSSSLAREFPAILRSSVEEILEQNENSFKHPEVDMLSSLKSIDSRSLYLESDQTPSDIYPSDLSSLASPANSTLEFWKANGSSSETLVQRNDSSGATWVHTFGSSGKSSTDQAYRIKSSLENALKSSKSRSATNFFK